MLKSNHVSIVKYLGHTLLVHTYVNHLNILFTLKNLFRFGNRTNESGSHCMLLKMTSIFGYYLQFHAIIRAYTFSWCMRFFFQLLLDVMNTYNKTNVPISFNAIFKSFAEIKLLTITYYRDIELNAHTLHTQTIGCWRSYLRSHNNPTKCPKKKNQILIP